MTDHERTLARQSSNPVRHDTSMLETFFGFSARCSGCRWDARVAGEPVEIGGLAIEHAPWVRLFAPGGELIVDTAIEQPRAQAAFRAARDKGEPKAVRDVIAERLAEIEEARMEKERDTEESESVDMNERIREGVRSQRSERAARYARRLFGEREAEQTTGEEHPHGTQDA